MTLQSAITWVIYKPRLQIWRNELDFIKAITSLKLIFWYSPSMWRQHATVPWITNYRLVNNYVFFSVLLCSVPHNVAKNKRETSNKYWHINESSHRKPLWMHNAWILGKTSERWPHSQGMFELPKTGGMRHGKEGIRLVPWARGECIIYVINIWYSLYGLRDVENGNSQNISLQNIR